MCMKIKMQCNTNSGYIILNLKNFVFWSFFLLNWLKGEFLLLIIFFSSKLTKGIILIKSVFDCAWTVDCTKALLAVTFIVRNGWWEQPSFFGSLSNTNSSKSEITFSNAVFFPWFKSWACLLLAWVAASLVLDGFVYVLFFY